ncbi:MAG TPA: HAMP domain-containing sensor histidine kinase [Myxococcales bacterium]|jgi:signal transduction histidine kinase
MIRRIFIPWTPAIWIGAVQVVFTAALLTWIFYFIAWRARHPDAGWAPFVVGLILLVAMLGLAIGVVIHLSRQVAHNQATKDFVSQVSHDLRSPLAIVKLHLETLRLRELTPEQRADCISMALTELNRLEGGIEGVLTASRIERSALRIDAGDLALKPFLTEYAAGKRQQVELKGGSLVWEADKAAPLVARADPEALRQLLDNLVDNALTHCPRGVQVRLEMVEQARCAVLAVADDGPGLDPREHKKVFRIFYRAPPSRRHTKGTGLGLFIVAGIAKAHNGRVWVESAGEGQGCTFRVAIPLSSEASS